MAEAVIRTEELTCVFGSLRAVDRLSLEIPPGHLFGFLGPNGSGKTTTIRLLLGLLRPTGGRARVLGLDPERQAGEIRRQCGVLLEQGGLYERMTAWENLEFFARVHRMASAGWEGRGRELLAHFGLLDRCHEVPARWSRGMKQKLALACALLHRPALLFLDEPTASLDPSAAAQFRRELQDLVARQGVTVFLTTHNLVEAEQICTRVGVIHRGRVVAQGPPDELRRRPRLRIRGAGFTPGALEVLRARAEVSALTAADGQLLLDLRPGAEIPPLVRLLVEAGAALEEVGRQDLSLEEVFLELTREAP